MLERCDARDRCIVAQTLRNGIQNSEKGGTFSWKCFITLLDMFGGLLIVGIACNPHPRWHDNVSDEAYYISKKGKSYQIIATVLRVVILPSLFAVVCLYTGEPICIRIAFILIKIRRLIIKICQKWGQKWNGRI